jgi:hypothetical protein
MLTSLIAVVLVALPAQAQAQPADGAAQASEKKICRVAHVTSTRTRGTRVCKTKAEWEADAEAVRQSQRFGAGTEVAR